MGLFLDPVPSLSLCESPCQGHPVLTMVPLYQVVLVFWHRSAFSKLLLAILDLLHFHINFILSLSIFETLLLGL